MHLILHWYMTCHRKASLDHDMLSLIVADITENEKLLEDCESRISNQLVPKDSDDERGVIVEVRAGTGTCVTVADL